MYSVITCTMNRHQTPASHESIYRRTCTHTVMYTKNEMVDGLTSLYWLARADHVECKVNVRFVVNP